ncbi:MAG: electron transfer flavoprotein subunit beta/FixA family protein [Candidatus Poseidoniia archaeon]|nr:electron transfer flavoprotein subunit beta/FixA family protein [Candidatus Poseidoniia archaeon]MDP6658437.1 electron transfer flavoprotein subunit beta/FixA family protein [Candidatus Poseidoniia archaeon]MDP6834755.1 electron transfer flavoprotein subunit beta/FixA family protein [Candidatus Poseidoniia archaeon]
MKQIVVCLKVVPKPGEVKYDQETNTLDRSAAENQVNLSDKHALEAALTLKAVEDADVTVISMGPPMIDSELKLMLAMGADRTILLSDRAFAGADTYPTSRTLAAAIGKLAPVDLVLCGEESSDSSTGQVPPGIAEWLDWPQITYATTLAVEENDLVATREIEGGHEILAAPLPAVASVVQGSQQVRFPDFGRFAELESHDIEIWSAADLKLKTEEVGLPGSCTTVGDLVETAPPERKREFITGSPPEMVSQLVERLAGLFAPRV